MIYPLAFAHKYEKDITRIRYPSRGNKDGAAGEETAGDA